MKFSFFALSVIFCLTLSGAAPSDSSKLRAMTWNTFLSPDYRTTDDVDVISKFVSDRQSSHNLDVVCLQEVSSIEFMQAVISNLVGVFEYSLHLDPDPKLPHRHQGDLLCVSKYPLELVDFEFINEAQVYMTMTIQKDNQKWFAGVVHNTAGVDNFENRQETFGMIKQDAEDCADCVAAVFLGDTNAPTNSAIFSVFPLFEPVGSPTGGYAEKGIYCQSDEYNGVVYPREVDRIFAIRNARRSRYEVFESCSSQYSDHRALFAEFAVGAEQKIFIIRHGDRSDYDTDETIDYGNNSPISEIGELQAQIAGERVAQNYSLSATLVSPFLRALQSAMYLEQESSQFVEVEPGVQEDRAEEDPKMPVAPDFIPLERWTEILAAEDQDYAPLITAKVPETGDLYVSRIRKASELIQSAFPVELYPNIAIVTHASPALSLAIGFCENLIGDQFSTIHNYLSQVAEETEWNGKQGIAPSSIITVTRSEENGCLSLPKIDNSIWKEHQGPNDPFILVDYKQYWDRNQINGGREEEEQIQPEEGEDDASRADDSEEKNTRSELIMGMSRKTMVIVGSATAFLLIAILGTMWMIKRRQERGRDGYELTGSAVDLGV